jgi:hypothetical protein
MERGKFDRVDRLQETGGDFLAIFRRLHPMHPIHPIHPMSTGGVRVSPGQGLSVGPKRPQIATVSSLNDDVDVAVRPLFPSPAILTGS